MSIAFRTSLCLFVDQGSKFEYGDFTQDIAIVRVQVACTLGYVCIWLV